LNDLVRDRTFLARRHADLLFERLLVGDDVLRALHRAYCRESSEL
jgi:hypothetical protein